MCNTVYGDYYKEVMFGSNQSDGEDEIAIVAPSSEANLIESQHHLPSTTSQSLPSEDYGIAQRERLSQGNVLISTNNLFNAII